MEFQESRKSKHFGISIVTAYQDIFKVTESMRSQEAQIFDFSVIIVH